jgi:transcriptional regulator with XRE-family HTH domain
MGKKSTPGRVRQFRRDFALLREKYALNLIAEKIGVNPGNLSNYSRGSKTPGEDFLDRFYSIFAADIQELTKDFSLGGHGPVFAAEEPTQAYLHRDDRDDHIQTLKLNNEDLRTYLGTIVKSNEILALSYQKLADALIDRLDKLTNGARE